jgi:hypothetical protein
MCAPFKLVSNKNTSIAASNLIGVPQAKVSQSADSAVNTVIFFFTSLENPRGGLLVVW